MPQKEIEKALEIIKEAKKGVVFTGAGLSTASGIPDFRSANGIWTQYPVREYAYIDAFTKNPKKVWDFFKLRIQEMLAVLPNKAHIALAQLEKKGYLTALITQNIDNLHQRAQSKNVLELHGSLNNAHCLECDSQFPLKDEWIKSPSLPLCSTCQKILKPGVVFFGEPLPQDIFKKAMEQTLSSGFVIVAGTSAEVFPAAQIPYSAKRQGSAIIEINKEPTSLTQSITDVFLQGKVEEILPLIEEGLA